MCGKGPTQLIRLAAIIQTLHDAFEYAKKRKNEEMNKGIEDEINSTEYTCFINEENLDRAYKLLEFFNKNKFIWMRK